MERRSLSEKIVRNSFFNIVGYTWWALIAFFLTPYIIHHIDIVRYGIWAIVSVIVGYAGLLDLGIGMTFAKYIPEYYAKKDYHGINEIFNTGLVFYFIFSLSLIICAWVLINPMIIFFNIPNELYGETVFVFLMGILIYAISNTIGAFEGIQNGLLRMDLSNKVEIAVSIPYIVGTVYFLENGCGLPGLMVNNAIVIMLKSMSNMVIAFRLLPELKFNPGLFSRRRFKELFKYGIRAQVTRLEKITTFQTDKLLISHFLNISLVGFYQLGSLIVDKLRWLLSFLPFVLIPAASELDALEDKKRIYDLYYRGTKYLAAFAMPIFSFIFITAPLIMLTWMGEGYEKSTLVIRIFMPCYFINFLTGVASAIALGIGKPELQMRTSFVQLALNIVLSVVLILKIGFVGALIATFISLSLGSMWFIAMFHKHMKYPLYQFLKAVLSKPLIACLSPAIIIGALNYYAVFPQSRLINFFIFLFGASIYITFYMLTLLKIGYFDEYDIALIRKYTRSIKHAQTETK